MIISSSSLSPSIVVLYSSEWKICYFPISINLETCKLLCSFTSAFYKCHSCLALWLRSEHDIISNFKLLSRSNISSFTSRTYRDRYANETSNKREKGEDSSHLNKNISLIRLSTCWYDFAPSLTCIFNVYMMMIPLYSQSRNSYFIF